MQKVQALIQKEFVRFERILDRCQILEERLASAYTSKEDVGYTGPADADLQRLDALIERNSLDLEALLVESRRHGGELRCAVERVDGLRDRCELLEDHLDKATVGIADGLERIATLGEENAQALEAIWIENRRHEESFQSALGHVEELKESCKLQKSHVDTTTNGSIEDIVSVAAMGKRNAQALEAMLVEKVQLEDSLRAAVDSVDELRDLCELLDRRVEAIASGAVAGLDNIAAKGEENTQALEAMRVVNGQQDDALKHTICRVDELAELLRCSEENVLVRLSRDHRELDRAVERAEQSVRLAELEGRFRQVGEQVDQVLQHQRSLSNSSMTSGSVSRSRYVL